MNIKIDLKSITFKDLLVLLVLAAAVLMLAFIVYSQVRTMDQLQQELNEEEMALNEAMVRLETLRGIQEEAPLLEEQLAAYEENIPPDPQETLLLTYLSDLGDSYMERFTSISYGERQEQEEYIEIPVDMSFDVYYYDLLPLLEELAEEDRILRVDNLSISPTGEEEGALLNVNISAYAFYRDQ